ncbi:hypothetical protein EYF80_001392 [Liparis tanakae]|uniref:Uncharacterized protein n=1 Tax=Liparis tanakae TaxID=230148 RepID=A0A4Z2JD59_9TELE|nr:hypothetical protein EYF80_001392 [Liparis tanakae]
MPSTPCVPLSSSGRGREEFVPICVPYEAMSVCSKACGWACVCAVLSGQSLTAIERHKVWCFGALMQCKGHRVLCMYFYILNKSPFSYHNAVNSYLVLFYNWA